MIYHITPLTDWQRAQQAGQYATASLDNEGFIHASNREQVENTAKLFYHGQTGLVLLAIDPARLRAELRYEPGTTAQHKVALFPHVYGPINLDAVVQVLPFEPLPDGSFRLPDAA
jgi:uncharacterized protein (DUF952 family)